ncbi:hypothetical protein C0J52_19741 [Blattella germanica]|nr:hypothetical protein C0J52_19741 [Blattella germanica]
MVGWSAPTRRTAARAESTSRTSRSISIGADMAYNEKTHFLQAISSPFNLFFWVGHNDKDREKSYFLVQYVGPRTWSQRFRYSFTLKTSDGQQTLSEYQYTTSYMMDPYSLMNLGQCAIFYNSYVELCLSEAGTLTLELDVVFLDDRKMKMLFPDRV